jgi:hypothetical protein
MRPRAELEDFMGRPPTDDLNGLWNATLLTAMRRTGRQRSRRSSDKAEYSSGWSVVPHITLKPTITDCFVQRQWL